MNQILSNPYVAALIGALVGFGCIVAVALGPKFVRSGGDKAATGVMAGAMALSMIFILTALLLYVLVAPGGFIWFGVALAAGFLVGLAIMAVWLTKALGHDDQGR